MLQNQKGGLDINVNLQDAETVVCGSCDGRLFDQHFVLKRIPKVMIGAPTDVPVPIPLWVCASCGTINSDFVPRGVGTVEELFDIKNDEDEQGTQEL